MPPLNDETRYHLLKLLEEKPQLGQREMAQVLGVSLGKVNYCLRALMSCGWIKVKNSPGRAAHRAYAYYLTPEGIAEKGRVTTRFLKCKMAEYQELEEEFRRLKQGVNKQQACGGDAVMNEMGKES